MGICMCKQLYLRQLTDGWEALFHGVRIFRIMVWWGNFSIFQLFTTHFYQDQQGEDGEEGMSSASSQESVSDPDENFDEPVDGGVNETSLSPSLGATAAAATATGSVLIDPEVASKTASIRRRMLGTGNVHFARWCIKAVEWKVMCCFHPQAGVPISLLWRQHRLV